ncbi:TPA: hypothetical protein ACH3X2_013237 [Trebouxia sp. C0005]
MSDPNKWAVFCWLLVALLPGTSCEGKTRQVHVDSTSVVYLTMGALSVTDDAVSQPNATVVISCTDNTGLSFSNVSLGVDANAVSLTSTSASFSVDQQVGYLQYGRSIACSVDVQYYESGSANITDVSVLAAGNASCWYSYSLFVAASGSSTSAESWTCSTSAVSYVLTCSACAAATSSSKSSGMSVGQIETVCIVVGCSLVVALAVICGCSRISSWRRNDARDTQHLPEDAAKGVNLRPPEFFVASSASQRNIDSPRGSGPAVKRAVIPPVVIVSYGSMSTPTAHHFHHGAYALAQPDALQSEAGTVHMQHSPLQPLPEEPPFYSSSGNDPAVHSSDQS